MLIAVAIIGWGLFFLTAILYLTGNRINAKQLNGLELMCLTGILADEWHSFHQEQCKDLLIKHGDPENIDRTIYQMMSALTVVADQMALTNLEIARKEMSKHLTSVMFQVSKDASMKN